MPTNQALQVFYGTIPLILVLAGIFFREQMLLRDILAGLGRIKEFMGQAKERLTALEARAGIVFHP
jgi:hypothetical protein